LLELTAEYFIQRSMKCTKLNSAYWGYGVFDDKEKYDIDRRIQGQGA